VDVRSVKLDFRSEYRGMLRDLAGRMADLVADARSSAKTSFRSNFEERTDRGWFQVQLELLREILESGEFAAAIQRLLNSPHERLEQELEMIAVERPFKWTRRGIQSLVHSPVRRLLPSDHPLAALSQLASVPAQVPLSRKIPTTDTPENRFIKHALLDFHGFLSRAQKVFEKAGRDWSAAANLSRRLAVNVEQWISRPFFKGINDLRMLPLGSPVLQRKAGYREILRWWLRFRTAANLSWDGGEDLFRAGQRNVADLYEYWLFFGLLDWFCGRFDRNRQPPLIDELIDGLDGDSPNLRLKKRVPLGPFSGNFSKPYRRLHAAFSYNREFKVTNNRREEGSWTRTMHPDYTLTFWPALDGMTASDAARLAEEQELLVHVHFDAKYRVDSLNTLFGESAADDADAEDAENLGNYKRQDLLKMHAYRDAIKRSEGAYVLYPGSEQPCIMRGFHEILPGLGAFAVAPDENGKTKGLDDVAKFLDEVLENLCDRASLRERCSSSLHEALREQRALYATGDENEIGGLMLQEAPELDADRFRLPTAPDIIVIVGWFNSEREKNWILKNRKIVLRLGRRRGTLPIIKSLSAASHILLHGKSYVTVPGLFRIESKAGQVWTRKEVAAMGFPADYAKPADDIFAVFSVEVDSAFEAFSWDGHRLEAAMIRYRNRQRPTFAKQLTDYRRERTKPHLVSLADLQIALKLSKQNA
jgi:predicted component of viral defense system (DUF524 family)